MKRRNAALSLIIMLLLSPAVAQHAAGPGSTAVTDVRFVLPREARTGEAVTCSAGAGWTGSEDVVDQTGWESALDRTAREFIPAEPASTMIRPRKAQ